MFSLCESCHLLLVENALLDPSCESQSSKDVLYLLQLTASTDTTVFW